MDGGAWRLTLHLRKQRQLAVFTLEVFEFRKDFHREKMKSPDRRYVFFINRRNFSKIFKIVETGTMFSKKA